MRKLLSSTLLSKGQRVELKITLTIFNEYAFSLLSLGFEAWYLLGKLIRLRNQAAHLIFQTLIFLF